MPQELAQTADYIVKNLKHEPFYAYESTANSKMWLVQNHDPIMERIKNVRNLISNTAKCNLDFKMGYIAVWRFDEDFPQCPAHIDEKQTGSIVSCVNGTFEIILHDKNDLSTVDRVTVDKDSIVALNNTQFLHSVKGQGDLVVFGIDIVPGEYFARYV